MPRAKLRTSSLRDRILQAAIDLLTDEGPRAVTARNVAQHANTSPPAVYELFGDKAGLVREVFFEGFRRLRSRFEELEEGADAKGDVVATIRAFRSFIRDNPILCEVMFSRPFGDFDPRPEDIKAAAWTRDFVVGRVRRAIDAGQLDGDATDIAHAVVALTQGLAATELSGRLGTSQASIDRRWDVATAALLSGFAPR
ncbi:MAG TPA: TetR/AcrR family transcriptional regulator [Streptosporangiaceae bacterium]|nr:TetR/AcrR family transcriptional regulator [Streptosporangiaceae bacterium]